MSFIYLQKPNWFVDKNKLQTTKQVLNTLVGIKVQYYLYLMQISGV
jgi:hypothetical protein